MPNEWLRLPISPGAKVLLAHFCSAAGQKGESYYSYEQLSDVVGRSRSSVCAYVKELRRAGVLKSKEQKTANGYNYRLLISIIGWADLVASWTSSVKKNNSSHSQKNERSVQPTERNDPSGQINKNHKTNTTRYAFSPERDSKPIVKMNVPVWSAENEKEWRIFRNCDRDPFYNHGPLPPGQLIEKLSGIGNAIAHNIGVVEASEANTLALNKTKSFVETNNIIASSAQIKEFAQILKENSITQRKMDLILSSLQSTWQPFWRKLSSAKQLEDFIKSLSKNLYKEDAEALKIHNRAKSRLMIHGMILKKQQNRKFAA
jgi:biotin operon repressor